MPPRPRRNTTLTFFQKGICNDQVNATGKAKMAISVRKLITESAMITPDCLKHVAWALSDIFQYAETGMQMNILIKVMIV
jgi:hypothetical protein